MESVPQSAPSLGRVVESVLIVASEPVPIARLAAVTGATREEVEAALQELASDLADRGVRLLRHGDAVQLVTDPEAANAVERYLGLDESGRLSLAALETLAIVAYRQPVTRAQIEAIRGVNCGRALSTLEARGLIVELGRLEVVGRPVVFGTTPEFLQAFGLTSLDDLPPLEDDASRKANAGEG